jgi:hypothetical protein
MVHDQALYISYLRLMFSVLKENYKDNKHRHEQDKQGDDHAGNNDRKIFRHFS